MLENLVHDQPLQSTGRLEPLARNGYHLWSRISVVRMRPSTAESRYSTGHGSKLWLPMEAKYTCRGFLRHAISKQMSFHLKHHKLISFACGINLGHLEHDKGQECLFAFNLCHNNIFYDGTSLFALFVTIWSP